MAKNEKPVWCRIPGNPYIFSYPVPGKTVEMMPDTFDMEGYQKMMRESLGKGAAVVGKTDADFGIYPPSAIPALNSNVSHKSGGIDRVDEDVPETDFGNIKEKNVTESPPVSPKEAILKMDSASSVKHNAPVTRAFLEKMQRPQLMKWVAENHEITFAPSTTKERMVNVVLTLIG